MKLAFARLELPWMDLIWLNNNLLIVPTILIRERMVATEPGLELIRPGWQTQKAIKVLLFMNPNILTWIHNPTSNAKYVN
jgi:hypothetical protein